MSTGLNVSGQFYLHVAEKGHHLQLLQRKRNSMSPGNVGVEGMPGAPLFAHGDTEAWPGEQRFTSKVRLRTGLESRCWITKEEH